MGFYPGLKFSSRIPFRSAPRQFGDIWLRNTLGRIGMIQGADVSLGQRDAALESVPANMHRTNESAAHFSHGRKSRLDNGGSATCRSSIASKDLRHRTAPIKRWLRHRSDTPTVHPPCPKIRVTTQLQIPGARAYPPCKLHSSLVRTEVRQHRMAESNPAASNWNG